MLRQYDTRVLHAYDEEMDMNKIPVGLQLYTVRDWTEKDFVGTVRKVAEMGYAGR